MPQEWITLKSNRRALVIINGHEGPPPCVAINYGRIGGPLADSEINEARGLADRVAERNGVCLADGHGYYERRPPA